MIEKSPKQKAYLKSLEEDSRTVALSQQILAAGPLKRFIVSVPILATEDIKLVENFLNEHAKQNHQLYTIVAFPNTSNKIDKYQLASERIASTIEKLSGGLGLDVRVIRDPKPRENFISIGDVRKTMWDAIILALESHSGQLDVGLSSEKFLDKSEFSHLLSKLSPEAYIFNQDVDLVKLPKDFMKDVITHISGLAYLVFASGQPPVPYFKLKSKHASFANFPNIARVSFIHDLVIRLQESTFEAGLVISAGTYAEHGGFSRDSCTYEVAGFLPNTKSPGVFLSTRAYETHPRRLIERLPEVTMGNVWTKVEVSTPDDFGETDSCRTSNNLTDISREQSDDLIKEWLESTRVEMYLVVTAYSYSLSLPEVREIVDKRAKVTSREESESLWQEHRAIIHKKTWQLFETLSKGLQLLEVSGGEELISCHRELLEGYLLDMDEHARGSL